MFDRFLVALRAFGVPIATAEWVAFLGAVKDGHILGLDEVYTVGRALLCRSEIEFDAFDQAFAAAFKDAAGGVAFSEALREWLSGEARERAGAPGQHDMTEEELWKELEKRLNEQKEKHEGGNYWVGQHGTSPFGNSGAANQGIRIGGSGGGRSAINVATERRWENYRSDRALDIRDLQVALRALRKLTREGRYELDVDETIDRTSKDGGEISIVERRERANQVHVVLLLDAGGSMAPHARKVEAFFSAAAQLKTFKSFKAYYFHNAPYHTLWTDFDSGAREPTSQVLERITPGHRLIFVGDASMAPYELFSQVAVGQGRRSGLDWLRSFRERSSASVWLNPDPKRWWEHPTVDAIGRIFPMFELTLEGLQGAVKKLRAPT
jgi:uncharacterized protein with von Willebrand factor type A (vWA) domain